MGMTSSAPPNYPQGGQMPMGGGPPGFPQQQMHPMPNPSSPPVAPFTGAANPAAVPNVPRGPIGQGWSPQSGGTFQGGPKAGQTTGGAPVSPEQWNAYNQLKTMGITGDKSKHRYNQAAKGYIDKYGKGYDPTGHLAKTNALRRYGG